MNIKVLVNYLLNNLLLFFVLVRDRLLFSLGRLSEG